MLIYSNGIVIMWQAACCAVCQASDRPVIRGTQHIHHRHFNNPTNEPPTRTAATTAVLTSEEKPRLICWWWFYIKCATFSQTLSRPLTPNEGEEAHTRALISVGHRSGKQRWEEAKERSEEEDLSHSFIRVYYIVERKRGDERKGE